MRIKEILVLHHSHFDIGYTHSQPVLWNLQSDFIYQAFEMLDLTENWPEISKPKWTIEVTAQIHEWIRRSDKTGLSLERFKSYIDQGRIGLSGLEYNSTPLCNFEQMITQIEPVRKLRELLGCRIKTAIQHDVNGIPWPAVELLKESGIETLIFGINPHLGRAAANRPSIFNWEGPSGKSIRVVNGEHYTMFDQQLNTTFNSLEAMSRGVKRYLKKMEESGYRQDFIYLTSTNIPVCWDNSPPNMQVAELIKAWNESGKAPLIRYITPDELSDRVSCIKDDDLPLLRGDWTDFWNFGCASSAYETCINQGTKSLLFSAELMDALTQEKKTSKKNALRRSRVADSLKTSWRALNIYDEHTWGCDESMDVTSYNTRSQWAFKAINAYEAREQAFYAFINSLENFSGNPEQSEGLEGIMLCNFTGLERQVPVQIPLKWDLTGKQLRTARYRFDMQVSNCFGEALQTYAPVIVPPYGFVSLRLEDLKPAPNNEQIKHGSFVKSSIRAIVSFDSIKNIDRIIEFIESPFHRIEFDPRTGRIISLYDKSLEKEILDTSSPWTLFQLVRETPDPLIDPRRESYYERDFDKLLDDESCWNTSWASRREGAAAFISYSVERATSDISLVLRFDVNGLKQVEQRIVLHSDIQDIDFTLSCIKEEYTGPESYYLVYPLSLQNSWEALFDTADTEVRLDEDQLPGSCKDWVTVESYAVMRDKEVSVTLITPDAPMVMFGDFNFSKESTSIVREKNPLLLSWPMNNYWNTNFRSSQAGYIQLRYALRIENINSVNKRKGDDLQPALTAQRLTRPIITHPLTICKKDKRGVFFSLYGADNVRVTSVTALDKKLPGGNGFCFRLVNSADTLQKIRLKLNDSFEIHKALLTTVLGETVKKLDFHENEISVLVESRSSVTIQIEC